MFSATLNRPGTPFPTTESISYFNLTPAQTSSRRLSTSVHFPMTTRPVLTPPSLLQRTSSTGSSSSSSYQLSKTPTFHGHGHGRRSSTCSSSSDCSSSMSSPMPTTPMVIAEEEEDEMNFGSSFKLQLPEAFTLNTPTKSKSSPAQYPYLASTVSASLSPMSLPSRPKLKRRDTPRPKSDVFSMAPLRQIPALSSVEEDLPKRRFTSIVDGKSWVVVA
jgi:hypothetical protein